MTEGKPSEIEVSMPSTSTQPVPANTTVEAQTTVPTPSPQVSDRSELLSRARGFLQSPHILQQDINAKRQFLVEKGLNEAEIEGLLQELPIQRPAIPPRSYPQPPPSNLPALMLGLTRIFSWIAGGSAALIFIYYRFLLPRIAQTSLARQSIRSHHTSLLRRLNGSLESLKQSQTETHSVLPSPDPSRESENFQACHSIADILQVLGEKDPDMSGIPPITLLRCALEGFGKGKDADKSKPTTEELFQYMEGQIPWLVSEDAQKYERSLWETLFTFPLFADSLSTATATENVEDKKLTRWTYTAPGLPEPSPVLQSMKQLTLSLPKSTTPKDNSRQHTLQALSDFTGYISSQMYTPYQAPTSAAGFLSGSSSVGPAEEEFKREIRALKGLVLNRRSFISGKSYIGSPSPGLTLPTP